MLKFIFAALLLANALLLAAHQGYLGEPFRGSREPARMGRQLNADRIVLQRQSPAPMPQAAPAQPTPPAEPAPAQSASSQPAPVQPVSPNQPAPAASDSPLAACTEIGNFGQGDAVRFQARLAGLQLAVKPVQREIRDTINYMVLIPPQGGKEGADAAVAQLRRLGIADFFVIQDNSPRQWGVSLGQFRSADAANSHLAAVTRKGVPNARVAELTRVAFQLRGLDDKTRASVAGLMADFPRQEMRGCD
jgi:hypothetical protein